MKKLFIICIAVLFAFALTACQSTEKRENLSAPGDPVNPTVASAKITLEGGDENSEWIESTGGAADIDRWISGFEVKPVDSVLEGGRKYLIELSFGVNNSTSVTYLDCGEHGCYLNPGDGWYSVTNPSPMPRGYVRELGVDVRDIVKVEYAHAAEVKETELSDKEKMSLSEWLSGVKYEHRWFPEGEAPGDSNGGEAYTFTFGNGELTYVVNGPDERFLLHNGEWYGVSDSGEFPIRI